jgi:hypothetical protein
MMDGFHLGGSRPAKMAAVRVGDQRVDDDALYATLAALRRYQVDQAHSGQAITCVPHIVLVPHVCGRILVGDALC